MLGSDQVTGTQTTFWFHDSMRPLLRKFSGKCNKFKPHMTCSCMRKCGRFIGNSSIVPISKQCRDQQTQENIYGLDFIVADHEVFIQNLEYYIYFSYLLITTSTY